MRLWCRSNTQRSKRRTVCSYCYMTAIDHDGCVRCVPILCHACDVTKRAWFWLWLLCEMGHARDSICDHGFVACGPLCQEGRGAGPYRSAVTHFPRTLVQRRLGWRGQDRTRALAERLPEKAVEWCAPTSSLPGELLVATWLRTCDCLGAAGCLAGGCASRRIVPSPITESWGFSRKSRTLRRRWQGPRKTRRWVPTASCRRHCANGMRPLLRCLPIPLAGRCIVNGRCIVASLSPVASDCRLTDCATSCWG